MRKKNTFGHVYPFSILRLNTLTESSWAVVDSRGAIVPNDGLTLKLTKDEARAVSARLNAKGEALHAQGAQGALGAPPLERRAGDKDR